jgi:hypothetical protein
MKLTFNLNVPKTIGDLYHAWQEPCAGCVYVRRDFEYTDLLCQCPDRLRINTRGHNICYTTTGELKEDLYKMYYLERLKKL